MKNIFSSLKKLSPAYFTWFLEPKNFEIPNHIKLLDKKIIEFLLDKEKQILVINMPPRHGKSYFLTTHFPFWYLVNFPNNKLIISSYEANIAKFFGKQVRELFYKHGYKFNMYISKDNYASDFFGFENKKGFIYTCGVGGSITGRGGNLLILDDPIKNIEEANSKTYRDNLLYWYQSTFRTRLEPGGKIILIMTRWHIEDLSGYIFEHIKTGIESVVLPAIDEENNKALWSERYDLNTLLNLKNEIGDYFFNCLYQQKPYNETDNYFNLNNFIYYENIEFEEYFLIMDLAITENNYSDYNIFMIFAIKDTKIFIDRITRFKGSYNDIEIYFSSILSKYQNKIKRVFIEVVAFQKVVFEIFENKYFCLFHELHPFTNKQNRTIDIQILLNKKLVYIKNDIENKNEFFEELKYFPNFDHDDMVDVFSYLGIIYKLYTSSCLPKSISIKESVTKLFPQL